MSKRYILGLDASTKTIGVALYEDLGKSGKLAYLTAITPKVKKSNLKMEMLFDKAKVFKESFLDKYKDFNITNIVIEEPLLGSNNIYTVATLLRYNTLIADACYKTFNIVPEFISSYDSRKYAFPELMGKRMFKKDGTPLPESKIEKSEPVLFGSYPYDVDKKMIVWEKVDELEPAVQWIHDKKGKLKAESFDMSDAITCVQGYMKKNMFWT
jgi:hypothetical protein